MSPEQSSTILTQGKLTGTQAKRLPGLFDMMYRPSELADEIGFDKRLIYRVYIPAGLPHERDEFDHIWINGELFCNWYSALPKKRRMAPDEAYCVSCKRVVRMADAGQHVKDGLTYLQSACPNCGGNVTRIVTQKRHAKPK